MTPELLKTLPLYLIAQLIFEDWANVYFGARPYLQAMNSMETIQENYGADSGDSIVLYFLANANTWRGPMARMVKKELNRRVKEYHG
jgi:hypothetical protein